MGRPEACVVCGKSLVPRLVMNFVYECPSEHYRFIDDLEGEIEIFTYDEYAYRVGKISDGYHISLFRNNKLMRAGKYFSTRPTVDEIFGMMRRFKKTQCMGN